MEPRLWVVVVVLGLSGCAGAPADHPSQVLPPASSAELPDAPVVPTDVAPAPSAPASAPEDGALDMPPTILRFAAVRVDPANPIYAFRFDATDAAGSTLNWTLDASGDGVSDKAGSRLPGEVVFSYGRLGNLTATLTVTDGTWQTVRRVDVVSDIPGLLPPFTLAGETLLPGNPAMCEPEGSQDPYPCRGAKACNGFASNLTGLDCVFGPFDARYGGSGYELSGNGPSPSVDFWTSCDAETGRYVGGGTNWAGERVGVVPEGAACAILWDYSAYPGVELRLDVSAALPG